MWPWPCWLSSVSFGWCCGVHAFQSFAINLQRSCAPTLVQTVNYKSLITGLFAAACRPCSVLTCFCILQAPPSVSHRGCRLIVNCRTLQQPPQQPQVLQALRQAQPLQALRQLAPQANPPVQPLPLQRPLQVMRPSLSAMHTRCLSLNECRIPRVKADRVACGLLCL